MKTHKRSSGTFRLAALFSALFFAAMSASGSLVFGCIVLLSRAGLLRHPWHGSLPQISMLIASVFLGTLLAFWILRVQLKPLREIMDATDRIASGDYSARVTPSGSEDFRRLGEKFNHMAEEIGSVEMLRSDFVNNFSHEFKTPIVSIRGFARALKWEDLSPEERDEYLNIIIRESDRLTELSSSVLDLTRIEKQTILTDVTRFNLTEQLRLAVVILDSKWGDRMPELRFECGEVMVSGCKDLLDQVWLNLLDNAIKFTPQKEWISVSIETEAEGCSVTIRDNGMGMSEETRKHIFDKFYQGDPSRSTAGNGLGLPIAARIVGLHGGTLRCESSPGNGSVFTVFLPAELPQQQ